MLLQVGCYIMLLQVGCYIMLLQVGCYVHYVVTGWVLHYVVTGPMLHYVVTGSVLHYVVTGLVLRYIPTAIRGSYTLQFLVVSGGHMRRQVIGETIPFRSPVITNFRAVMRPLCTEGWSELTTGCRPMMSESEILGGGISEITGNFCLGSDIGLGSMST